MSKTTPTIVLTATVENAPPGSTYVLGTSHIFNATMNDDTVSGNIAFVDSTRGTLYTVPLFINVAVYQTNISAFGTQPAHPALSPGTYVIIAQYAGDSSHNPATSNAVTVVVLPQASAAFSVKTVITSLAFIGIVALVIFYFRRKKHAETAANVTTIQ
jgi:hypothetical protein